jgi:pimeloyl-ACP methyl ester carboxylesterase
VDYSIADLSAQLAEPPEVHKTGRIHLAGISPGGLIAQHFAATRPELVDRLVLIDTTPRYIDDMRTMWAERAASARQVGAASLIDGLLKIWFTAATIERNGPDVQYVRSTISQCSNEATRLPRWRWRTFETYPRRSWRRHWSFAAMTTSRVSWTLHASFHRASVTQLDPGSLKPDTRPYSNSGKPACNSSGDFCAPRSFTFNTAAKKTEARFCRRSAQSLPTLNT